MIEINAIFEAANSQSVRGESVNPRSQSSLLVKSDKSVKSTHELKKKRSESANKIDQKMKEIEQLR